MKIFRRVLIILLCIASLAALVGLLLPRKILVQRSLLMDANQKNIFAKINTLKTWEKWSPLLQIDSGMKIAYSGSPSGTGAALSWRSSNRNIGYGRISIISAAPYDSIRLLLDFGKNGTSVAKFTLHNTGLKTMVTWSIESELGLNVISRWVGLFSDRLIGPDLETGLINLNQLLIDSKTVNGFEILDYELPERILLSVRDTASPGTISTKLASMYSRLTMFINSRNLPPTGSPVAIFHASDNRNFDVEAGIPVKTAVEVPAGLQCTLLKPQKTIMVNYFGAYKSISGAYDALQKYMNDNAIHISGPGWEEYVTKPSAEADTNKWQTRIYYPVE